MVVLHGYNLKACLCAHPQPTPPPTTTVADRSVKRLPPLMEVLDKNYSGKAHFVRLIYRLKLGFFRYFCAGF